MDNPCNRIQKGDNKSKYNVETFALLGMSRSVDWLLVTDVSIQPNGLFFKVQAVQTESIILDSLTFVDGPDSSSRNVSNYQTTLNNLPEERRSHLHRDGKSEVSQL